MVKQFQQPCFGVGLSDRCLIEGPLQLERIHIAGVTKRGKGDIAGLAFGPHQHFELTSRCGNEVSHDLLFTALHFPPSLQRIDHHPDHRPAGGHQAHVQRQLRAQQRRDLC